MYVSCYFRQEALSFRNTLMILAMLGVDGFAQCLAHAGKEACMRYVYGAIGKRDREVLVHGGQSFLGAPPFQGGHLAQSQ